MNYTTYFFGIKSNKYIQYPDDDSKKVFETFLHSYKDKTTALAIHREKGLVYCAYMCGTFPPIKKENKNNLVDFLNEVQIQHSSNKATENTNIVGLCIVINGQMFRNITPIFSMFENLIESFVLDGELIQIDGKGIIFSKEINDKNQGDQGDFIRAKIKFDEMVDTISDNLVKLPPMSYNADNSVQHLHYNDNEQAIWENIFNNEYSIIEKNDNHYLSKLKTTIETITKFDKEIQKTIKKKERITSLLFILLSFLSSFAIYFTTKDILSNSINEKQTMLDSIKLANNNIQSYNNIISTSSTNIKNKLTFLKSNNIPLVIENISATYNGNIQLSIDIIPIIYGNIRLQIRMYDKDGIMLRGGASPNKYTHIENISISPNAKNIKITLDDKKIPMDSFNFHKGFPSGSVYYVDVLYNEVCIFDVKLEAK